MALRFLLGFVEAVIFPCLTLIVQAFYTRAEQPPRNASKSMSMPSLSSRANKVVIFAYFSSVFNGLFSWLVGLIPEGSPLARWQYLYLLTGSINICWAIFLYMFLPDSPLNSRFLTDEEKYYAMQRLAENRTGVATNDRTWNWSQALEAVLDIKVWLIFLFNIAINIPNGGLLTFGSIIIKNLGFDSLEASLLTMPFGVFATFGAWVFSFIAARWHNRRTIVAAVALLLPLVGTALVYSLPKTQIGVQMFGLYLMYLYWRMFLSSFHPKHTMFC